MNIRLYQAEDKEACLALFKSNMPEYFAPSEFPEFELWLDALGADKKRHQDPGTEQYFVVDMMGKVVGCGGYAAINPNEVTLTWGMVDRSAQGTGWGKALLQYRLKVIQSRFPAASIMLDTTQLSYRFFERQGFKVTAIMKDFYGAGLDRYDMRFTC